MPQANTDQTTQLLPTQLRAAQIEPATFDAAKRTVEVVFTTGAKVRRYDWNRDRLYDEELVVSTDAIDMARMNAGASVLNTHGQYRLEDVIGVVERAWITGTEGRATVRLSDRPELAGLIADIQSGIIRHISAGYSTQAIDMIPPQDRTDGEHTRWLYRSTRWTPAEISFVPVPADAGSGTRSHPTQGGQPCVFTTRAAAQKTQGNTMPESIDNGGTTAAAALTPTVTPAIPAATPIATTADTRAADIADLCARHGVPTLASGLIRAGSTVDAAGLAVLSELARRDAAAGGHRNVTPITTVRDEMTVRMAGIEQAILHRVAASTQLDDNGKQYRGLSLIEMGRDFLESHGQNTRGLDRMTLASRMLNFRAAGPMGTSDFSSLFANVANKRLRSAYDENAGTYALWARRAPNAPDFKNMSVVQLAGAPDLLQTNEAGEFKYGAMSDGGETYAMLTYGRIVSLTRQAIVNDDLRAFERMVTAFGFAARRLENRTVYAQLTANANLADGTALFAAGHSNLVTGSALAIATLGAGRTAMRLQKGLQNEELNLAPSYLIVPAALEQTAYNLTSANYVPSTKSEINEFRAGGRTSVAPIVEPVLDANSATSWYLAASNSQVHTVEYCYLDGAEGPVIESEVGFETDGVSYKCRLDFAAKAVDHRGLLKATA